MDELQRKINKGAKYLTVALMAAAFTVIFLYPPINSFLMRSSRSYVMYSVVFALLIALVVYGTERLLADVFGVDGTQCYE